MEQITMTVATTFSGSSIEAKFNRLWIGQEEVPVGNRSIAQWLEEMHRQGWDLTNSRATANFDGILCEYDFERPIAVPQREEVLSPTLARRRVSR